MKTKKITAEQMEKYIARFSDMKPLSSSYDASMGIPKEAYETMTAKNPLPVDGARKIRADRWLRTRRSSPRTR